MRQPPFIGNDIVDLSRPEAREKLGDRRFLDRVFLPEERERIISAANPFQTLWSHWAAKEASFKVIRKLKRDQVFAHQRFRVMSDLTSVAFEDLTCALNITPTQNYVHAQAIFSPQLWNDSSVVTAIRALQNENPSRQEESHEVRKLALELLEKHLNISGAEIHRDGDPNCPNPPVFMLRGEPLDSVDLSLSHDGRWLAAALFF